jgi:outer membrane protein OmpA-like peptidoglycan-associated protein
MQRGSPSLFALFGGFLVTTGAAADPVVSAELPALTVAGDESLLVESAGARGDGVFRAKLVAEYSREPLVLTSDTQESYRVVLEQWWLHPSISLALAHRFFLGIELPVLLSETGDEPQADSDALPEAGGAALGDPRVVARARVLGEPDALHSALGAELFLPLGGGNYAGDGSFRARPFAALGVRGPRFFFGVDAGYLFREGRTLSGLLPTRVGSALTAGVATGVAIDRAGDLLLGPELAGSFTVGEGAKLFDPRSTVVTLLAHARYRIAGGPLELEAAFGPSLGQAPGASDHRALLSVGFSPEAPPPPEDGDLDRVPDERDMCPSLPGVASEDPLMDGCPEVPTDTDGDGIPDIYDACPRTPGEATGSTKTHGCPRAPDTDRDGIADPEDACSDLPGVPHSDSKLNGCPKPAPKAELVERTIRISQEVQFETGTAVLRAESDQILGEVAAVLKADPTLELVEVAGHTDDTGTPSSNQRLSLARAQAVVDWLAAHGIERARLEAKGYGETRPVADNSRSEGRARNRRVEFKVLRLAGEEATP